MAGDLGRRDLWVRGDPGELGGKPSQGKLLLGRLAKKSKSGSRLWLPSLAEVLEHEVHILEKLVGDLSGASLEERLCLLVVGLLQEIAD
jgi:hypothetical protein